MKKKVLITIVVVIIFLLLISLLIGLLSGFPWERKEASRRIREYVKNMYNLTVTDINTSFAIDGMNYSRVFTKELEFPFEVMISRGNYTIWEDLYLERLVEHTLETFMANNIYLVDEVEKIRVVLQTRFSKDDVLTVDEVHSTPKIVLDLPEITYFCSVDVEDSASERTYTVFKEIVENFNPTSIYFHCQDESSICISSDNYSKILSAKDLIIFAE